MASLKNQQVPVYAFNLHFLEVLDANNPPTLRLYRDEIGTRYLGYLIGTEDMRIAKSYLVALSRKRLYALRQGDMTPVEVFENAENGVIFLISSEIDSPRVLLAQAIRLSEFKRKNEIDRKLRLSKRVPQKAIQYLNQQTLRYARERDRIILDLRIQSKSLAFESRPWFWDKVMSPTLSILKDVLDVTGDEANKMLAFSNFRDNFSAFSFEIRYTNTLFEIAPEFEQATRLTDLLNISDQQTLQKQLSALRNRQLVREYLNILKVLVQEEAQLQVSLANPVTREVRYAQLDLKKAKQIQKLFETDFPEIEQTEVVEGVFLEINLNRRPAIFKVFDTAQNRTIRGFIPKDLAKKVARDRIVFGKQRYRLDILTRYRPETLLHKEQWRRYLNFYEEWQDTDELF
ncbi:MAG: hypothetical protein AAF740_04765 [Bacteroidota bacterium]